MRPETEKPHVLHPIEGLRNLDYIAINDESFLSFLLAQKYLGHGVEALVLHVPDTNNVIRLPYFNFLGQEKIVELLEFFLPFVKIDRFVYVNTLERIRNTSLESFHTYAQQSQEDMLRHVAAANSRFRHDPGKTIPVNTLYTFNDQPVATLEKYIEGRKAYFETQIVGYEKEISVNGGDFAVGNIFFDVSPYVDENGQVRFLHPHHLIDFSSFVPSNH